MFYANNNGMCRNVRILGQGAIGLDLSYALNGPLLVSNVEIDGFDVGIKGGSGTYNSQTLEHVMLKNQREWGIRNDGECLMIRDLRSSNGCPAVFTRGNMVLVDSKLAGGGPEKDAVVCAGQLFARNVRTSGYRSAIQKYAYDRKKGLGGPEGEPVPDGLVEEWTSSPAAGTRKSGGVRSISLPVEEAPYIPLEKDFSKWVCVDEFGADGSDKDDDTEAIRKALAAANEDGKTVVSFRPNARYVVGGELVIDGGIERLQGANSYLVPGKGQEIRMVVKDGKSPVVLFDLLDRPLGRYKVTIENASSRTLVVRNFRARFVGSGPGKTFLEDSCGSVWIENARHRCWVRQLNSESGSGLNNHNKGGTLWVLGLKSERNQMLLLTTGGGRSEVLGVWAYQTLRNAPPDPMFRVVDSAGSFAGICQWNWKKLFYTVLLEDTRGGSTRQVSKDQEGVGIWSPLVSAN
jgi:hypothetical protein